MDLYNNSLFLKKLDVDITSSDYDDPDIEQNIRFNAQLNDME